MVSWSSLELVMPSSHLILCCPLLLLSSIFPASGSFPMSLFFASGGQSIGAPASISVLPMNTQSWFSLGWTGWIALLSSGLSRVFSSTTVQKHQFFGAQLSLWSNSHIHTWVVGKAIALTIQTFVGKVMSLLFNILGLCIVSRFVHSGHWAQNAQSIPHLDSVKLLLWSSIIQKLF